MIDTPFEFRILCWSFILLVVIILVIVPGYAVILSYVRDKPELARRLADRKVGRLKSRRKVDKLARLLGHHDFYLRTSAEQALQEMGEPAIDQLVAALEDPNRKRVFAAAKALSLLSPSATGRLVQILEDRDHPEPRPGAVLALGLKWSLPGMLALRTALYDPDEGVKSMAATGLANLGDTDSIEDIIDILREEETSSAAAALQGFREALKMGADPISLYQERKAIRQFAEDSSLGMADEHIVEGLILAKQSAKKMQFDMKLKEVKRRTQKPELYVRALTQLFVKLAKQQRRRGRELPGRLLEALRDRSFQVRRAAVSALGEIGDEAAIEPLIRALGDRSQLVDEAAAASLRSITGQDFGMDLGAWRRWANEQGHLVRRDG